jgi:uncharacterized Zn-binding protein involved in type VI secretion
MPGACRLGDKAKAPIDVHGCVACPHPNVQGPAISASGNVNINGAPALRQGDSGIHMACCGPAIWKVLIGSGQVMVNGMPLARQGDPTQHCGGLGTMQEASRNVFDGSALNTAIVKWLEGVQATGLELLQRVLGDEVQDLLLKVSLTASGAYWALDETMKLNDKECRENYIEHVAKCWPGTPPVPPGGPPPRYRGPPDLPVEPVGVFDWDNPITPLVMAPVGPIAKGVGAVPEGISLIPKAPGAIKDGVEALGGFVSGLAPG